VAVTREDRQTQRLARIRRRTGRALKELGIDLETVPETDQEALEIAALNVDTLRAIGNRMRQRTPATAPTAERIAHAIEEPREIEVQPDQPKSHRIEWALEGIRDRMPSHAYDAAVRLQAVYLAAEPASRVADPTAVGGSSDPSKRLAITERQERAGRELSWIMGRLDQPFRSTVKNFILEAPREGAERCLTISEWGTKTARYSGDMARAAGATAIILACLRLATLWEVHDSQVREACAKTDRMMRSEIGWRAARDGWICALWDWCRRNDRLPTTQGEMDEIRASHDTDAKRLRGAPPIELDRWQRRRDRLISVAFRGFGDERVRVA
jgi:hypothetical protein